LKGTALRCTLGVAFSMASMPWLQSLRVHHSLDASLRRLLGLVIFLVAALVSGTWVRRMLDFWHVVWYLRPQDLAAEQVKLVIAQDLVIVLFMPTASLIVCQWCLRRRRKTEVSNSLRALEEALWRGDSEKEQLTRACLEERGLSSVNLSREVEEIRRRQSQEAGVSVAYLLSEEFLELARARTNLDNPTFLQMKDAFWVGEDAVGKDVLCPRDGRPGCALVDTLHPKHRRRCTHFLSWVWRYDILLVREALLIWTEEEGLDPNEIFLFMCFFVNNQFRILIEGTQSGSDDLETTFEQNLRRIGRLIALLDHWEEPLYLSRIWTIYEQYVAAKLQLPVTIILDRKAGESLIKELDRGKEGILHITGTLCHVRAELAEASVKADEEHVKAMICSTMGFDYVNNRVRHSMTDWVSCVLKRHMDQLVANVCPTPAEQVRRVSCTQLPAATGLGALEVESE